MIPDISSKSEHFSNLSEEVEEEEVVGGRWMEEEEEAAVRVIRSSSLPLATRSK